MNQFIITVFASIFGIMAGMYLLDYLVIQNCDKDMWYKPLNSSVKEIICVVNYKE